MDPQHQHCLRNCVKCSLGPYPKPTESKSVRLWTIQLFNKPSRDTSVHGQLRRSALIYVCNQALSSHRLLVSSLLFPTPLAKPRVASPQLLPSSDVSGTEEGNAWKSQVLVQHEDPDRDDIGVTQVVDEPADVAIVTGINAVHLSILRGRQHSSHLPPPFVPGQVPIH